MNKWQRELYEKSFRVAVFGSARIRKNDPHYKQIYSLAKMIAREDIDIVTGGGPGLMEAANKGHQEIKRKAKGVHSIGLNIKLPREQKANRHLDIEREFHRFSKRLDTFVKLSNVVVVAPGGIGTVLELYYVWQLTQVNKICDVPIILLGDMWSQLLEWSKKWQFKRGLVSKEDFFNVFVAKNSSEAMRIIKAAKKVYEKSGKYACVNIKRYIKK